MDLHDFKDETNDIRQLNYERYFNKGKFSPILALMVILFGCSGKTPHMNHARRGQKKGTIGDKYTEKFSIFSELKIFNL